MLLSGQVKLEVPVYTVWGACEDVRVLEKFRSGEYKVPNLHIIDEARSMLLELGGVKLRLLGLGGAVVMHKLFDNGEGRTTIAGGQGTMWTTLLQMGELVDTANRVYDPTETRVFITHASPAREGILNQLSVSLKADFSVSAGLHFRYGSSYNEFSVNPTLDHYRGKLAASKASFHDVWETVKGEVEPAIQQNEAQQNLLKNALGLVEKMPTTAAGGNPFGGPAGASAALGQVDESAFKNMWNFNLADAAFGWLVLEIQDGRIGTEMRAQGFNFSHRGAKQQSVVPATSTPSPAPAAAGLSSAPTASIPSAPTGPQRNASAVQSKSAAATPLQGKPATPKPVTSSPAPGASAAKENERPGANGATSGAENAPSPAPRGAAADIIGLFIMNVQSDEQTRDIFPEEHKSKITKVDKWGTNSNNKVAHFGSTDDRDAALASLSDEYKQRQGEDRSKPLVKLFQPREGGKTFPRGGAGTWGSTRGNSSAQSGYRSATERGTASGGESGPESGRRGGRGGVRGRGDRGRGRGGRGGVKGEGASPAPTSAAPADS